MHNNRPDHMPVMNAAPGRREKLEGGRTFKMVTEFKAAGDQPAAITELAEGVRSGEQNQVLLGATGTGKTFTMAKVIEETQRPAIILAPNKTLAAQLYGEFKGFFPENAVEYFVSYYDYYQPEAYVPRSDTYIEKESQINEQIDRMRHSATRALLTAALDGSLDEGDFRVDANFGFEVPVFCPGVDDTLLTPRETWSDPSAYDKQAAALVQMFIDNFAQYEEHVGDAVRAAAPKVA